MSLIILLIVFIVLMHILVASFTTKQPQLPYLFRLNAVIDKCFTLKEKQFIINSIESWEEASHGLIKFDIVEINADSLLQSDEAYTVNFVKALKNDDVIKTCDELYKSPVVGYAAKNMIFGLIFIVTDRADTEKLFITTCTHEIGHILGLGHSTHANTVMHENVYKCCKHPSYNDIKDMIDIWRDVMSAYHEANS